MTPLMRIAIHHRQGSFSERWINYCNSNNISYKLVNAYDSDIIQQVEDCDAFMWHFHHADYRDNLFAKQLLFSLQQAGKKIFPDINTAWHFDDKIGKNCNISPGVNIGKANRGKNKGYPTIGDNVYIGPGAKIIGAVKIGNNVAIGANTVVTKDIPDNACIGGVPARILSMEGAEGYVNNRVN